ncbi:LysR family transcriptional regulator [Sphingomonadaceae bacterium G21617-S1]|jgi:DNA-binding transcriptional LysR family regulator|uniref:LysR family transcriptional regulator n=1 Tax=Rhizorhabdus sp. TaxID=1968843 RepID=UPI00120E7F44|nr:LysR family transcriptional regulator [Rhizorhabdus sp.]MBD3762375.1 LysR family transcriptional regulator [Rhizorhabdus sp.]MCZ4344121.1 LysR family transcriptional regulator [Sphingomonadaceae bacterium G21617-S1]TAK13811.1 MAG: LysR family transcriptional regulator [Rhizorhabdus sp.]
MRRLSLYHLETLLWISRLGTFAAAADRLNTTQPAISARIRELESQIGYHIFQRAGRRMELTVRGRELVRDCEPLWAVIERTLLQSNSFEGASGIVRIGAGEIAAASCLPTFLAELKIAMPRATIEVEIDLSQAMLRKLLGATHDLIFLAGPVSSPSIETRPIGDAEMIWVASPALGLDSGDYPADVPIWLIHSHSPIHALALASLGGNDPAGPVINLSNNVRTLIDIVLAGGGMSFVPEIMVRDQLDRGSLTELRFTPRRSIPFQIAIRAQERDPLIRDIFERATALRIDSVGGRRDEGCR